MIGADPKGRSTIYTERVMKRVSEGYWQPSPDFCPNPRLHHNSVDALLKERCFECMQANISIRAILLTLLFACVPAFSQGRPADLAHAVMPNGVVNVALEPGATADVKLNACIKFLSPSGGTCDARGFGGTRQTVAATVSTPGAYTVSLLFDPATTYQPGNASLTMFVLGPNTFTSGLHIDTSNQPAYSGTAVSTAGHINGNWALRDVTIHLSSTYGVGISLNGSSVTSNVVFARADNVMVFKGQAGLLLSATGRGYVNANTITNLTTQDSVHGVQIVVDGTQSVSRNYIQGNVEHFTLHGPSVDAVNIAVQGGGDSTNNNVALFAWDFPSNQVVSVSGNACANLFTGNLARTAVDTTSCTFMNNYFSLYQPDFTQLTVSGPGGITAAGKGGINSVSGYKVNGTSLRSTHLADGATIVRH
jgi:hypothetical protein